MEIKKVHTAYFSAAGTVRTVADRISACISCPEMQAEMQAYDLLRQPQDEEVRLQNSDLLVAAVPVYAGRVPAVCMESLRHFYGQDTPAVAVAVYGNRDYDDALKELYDLLCKNGFLPVGAGAFVAQHSIFPAVAAGRPDADDLAKIDAFAAACQRALLGAVPNKELPIKGNFPYKQPAAIPLKPSGDAKCIACGACAKCCPTGAIAADTPRKTDRDKCISCTACIAVCPTGARAFHGPAYAVANKAFQKKCAARREPELFFPE